MSSNIYFTLLVAVHCNIHILDLQHTDFLFCFKKTAAPVSRSCNTGAAAVYNKFFMEENVLVSYLP